MSELPQDRYLSPEQRVRVEILKDLWATAGELAAAETPANDAE
jgi:hypothetical protein